jgi:hypothetical protein
MNLEFVYIFLCNIKYFTSRSSLWGRNSRMKHNNSGVHNVCVHVHTVCTHVHIYTLYVHTCTCTHCMYTLYVHTCMCVHTVCTYSVYMCTNMLFGPFDHSTFHRSSESIARYTVTPAANAKHVTTVTAYSESHRAFTHSLWAVTFIRKHYKQHFTGGSCRVQHVAVVTARECFKLCKAHHL